MPPKRAARGPRPSTRRRNSQTHPAAEDLVPKKCSSVDTSATAPSNAAVAPSSPPTSGIPDTEVVDRGDCALPKEVTGLPSAAGNPSRDGDSVSQSGPEGASEPPNREDAALGSGSGLISSSPSETLGTIDRNPNSVSANVKDDPLSSSEAKDKVGAYAPSESNGAVGGEEAATVIESSGKDAAEGSVNGSGKKTRVVKKTIKVVKKIIKRVPKSSLKAVRQDSKIEALGSPEANDNLPDAGSAPSCSNSGEKEVQMNSGASSSPIDGNSSSVVSPALNADDTQMNVDSMGEIVKNMQEHLSAQEEGMKKETVDCVPNLEAVKGKSQSPGVSDYPNLSNAGPATACLNPEENKTEKLESGASCSLAAENPTTLASLADEVGDGQEATDSEEDPEESLNDEVKEIEKKSLAVKEDLQVQTIKNEDNLEISDNKEKVLPMEIDRNVTGVDCGVSTDENDAPEALNEDECRKRGRTEVHDEGNNAAKPESEMEDGSHYSGEMEAMERRKRRRTEIFVGGIDRDAKEEDIRKVFGQVGEVVDFRMPMSPGQGKNKGFAFVRYSSAVDAKTALEKFSNVKICGKQCSASPVEGNDTIYIGNINKNWKDEDVSKLLLGVGIEKIDTISVVKDPSNSGKNRGFAFVEFETCKAAEIALKRLQRKDIFGQDSKFRFSWAEQLSEYDEKELLQVKTVYAEFIPLTWDEANLREKFENFGEIESVVLAKNLRTPKRKDFAFISYKSRKAAIACIEALSHEPLSNHETKVNIKVSLALPNTRIKPKKQVTSPSSQGTSKGKPQVNPGRFTTKPIDQKRKGLLAVQRYGMHKPEHSTSFGEHRPEQSTVYGVRGREQTSRWPPPRTGPPLNVGHPTTHSAGTRPVPTLDPGLVHSGLNGLNRYPDFRLEASMHNNSREYMNGYPNHNLNPNPNYRLDSSIPFSSRQQYDGGYPHHGLEPRVSASSRYHQPAVPPAAAHPTPSLYPSSRDIYGLPYSAANPSTTEVENEILRRSALYRRY